MPFLYNYGISQEDAVTETASLSLTDGDSLLCIASAGEIPLNISVLRDVKIVAADVSSEQLKLCRIKQAAALHLDSIVAASFLGYMKMNGKNREEIFRYELMKHLNEDDNKFWIVHPDAIREGLINSGRFERYMMKVAWLGRSIVGKINLYNLLDCNSIEEQKEVFDKRINGLLVKGIFRTAFHPRIYQNRGIDPAGLTHSGARNIGEFFFHRFRNFCCNTPARKNYYLQYTFFNEILFREALPEFLVADNHARFARNINNTEYVEGSIENVLANSEIGKFNKVHISNIGDWMSGESMTRLFSLISDKTLPGARIAMRYIHLNHKLPPSLPELTADYQTGYDLEINDRYPFYSIVPISRI